MKTLSNGTGGCVLGIGEALWDLLPEGARAGGAPANFAFHVSQLGLEGRLVSAVGTDIAGRRLCALLRSRGLRVSARQVSYPTGSVRVTLDDAGKPEYVIREGTAWDNIPFTPALEKLARNARAICFGTLAQRSPVSRATILRVLDAMPDEEGRYKIFDINLRQNYYSREVIEASLLRCNILKINDEELKIVGEMFGLEGASDEAVCRELMQRYGLRIVILTCGEKGSSVYTPGDCSRQEPRKVDIEDTVGAGDSFTAAFIAALLSGRGIAESHRLATDVSAFVCTQQGAMPKLPEALAARLR